VFDGMDRSRIQPFWHSAHALGIVGAKGNNGVGIAGINWDVSMMLLKIGAQGTPRGAIDSLRTGRAARAIRYAADNGARIINWSGFVADRSPVSRDTLRAAIHYAGLRNVLIVVGAGNDALDLDDDANAVYPQTLDEPNLLRVAQIALDGTLYRYQTGGQWRGSNYGKRWVELAAPGENFTTSLRNRQSTYEVSNGTSNAAPVVTGVGALVLSVRPDLNATELKQILIDSGTPDRHLEGMIKNGRVVNPVNALHLARDHRK
jgi:subtilisin family serine protease